MKLNRWLDRWRLRRIIAALCIPVTEGGKPHVMSFCRTLEATELMTRSLKHEDEVTMTVTKNELTHFIRYMTSLHDSKLSKLTTARIGLATVVHTDEMAIGAKPKDLLIEEAKRTGAAATSEFIDPGGRRISR